MDLGLLFLGFLQRIALGAGTVFAVLLIIWLSLPSHSAITVRRRTTRHLPRHI